MTLEKYENDESDEEESKAARKPKTVRDHIEAMINEEDSIDALKLVSLAATHNIYFPDFEVTLLGMIKDKKTHLQSKVEATLTYTDLRAHVKHHKIDKNNFAFDRKEEREFINYIASSTDFRKLPNEHHLEAVQRFGIMMKNEIEFDSVGDRNLGASLLSDSNFEDHKSSLNDSSEMCKEILSKSEVYQILTFHIVKKITQLTKCKEEVQIQRLKQNINKFEADHDLENYLALRDTTLDALVQWASKDKLSLSDICDILNFTTDMNPTFIYDAQYLKLDKQLHLYVREEWIKKHIREIKNSDCLTIKDAERLATRLSSREHPLLLWSAHFIKNMFLRMKRSRGENHIFKFLDFWEKYSLGERSILGFSNWEGNIKSLIF